MSEKLKPCDCGSAPRISNYEGSAIHISCRCGLQLWGGKAHFGSEEEAIAVWNKRAQNAGEARPVAIWTRTPTHPRSIWWAEDGHDLTAIEAEQTRRGYKVHHVYAAPQPAALPEGWIPVSERMPERNRDVILALTTGAVLVGFYYGQQMGWDWAETDTDEDADAAVTHWMPLPAAPVAAMSASNEGA